jgi:DNA-binding transcriptional ArsR family regulator
MLLANVSRELRKLREMGLVRALDPEKHNYKPYVITERGLEIREMIESREDEDK